MSGERDELADDIRSLGITVVSGPPVDLSAPLAQHLRSLGYRKPRTVTTVEELETVYAGALLVDAIGEHWGVYGGEDRLFLVADGWEETYDNNDIPLPATVVWEPTNV